MDNTPSSARLTNMIPSQLTDTETPSQAEQAGAENPSQSPASEGSTQYPNSETSSQSPKVGAVHPSDPDMSPLHFSLSPPDYYNGYKYLWELLHLRDVADCAIMSYVALAALEIGVQGIGYRMGTQFVPQDGMHNQAQLAIDACYAMRLVRDNMRWTWFHEDAWHAERCYQSLVTAVNKTMDLVDLIPRVDKHSIDGMRRAGRYLPDHALLREIGTKQKELSTLAEGDPEHADSGYMACHRRFGIRILEVPKPKPS